MPILAGLISSLFGGIAALIGVLWAKKLSVAALAVIAFAAALTSLMIVFNSLVAPLVGAMFTTQFGSFIGLAFPPVAGTCLTSLGLCWSACMLYKLKIQSIKLTASA
jgi:hypothetical protein